MSFCPANYKFSCIIAILAAGVDAQTVTVSVDATAAGTTLNDVWSWHGYDEDNYTTTQPSKDLLAALVSNSHDPIYIRTHFLLNNTSGPPGLKWGSTDVYSEVNGQPVYNWKTLDSINDAITGAGAFPYFDFAFMPQALTSAPAGTPYRNSTYTTLNGGCMYPPTSYAKWATLIDSVAAHVQNRYPNAEQNWVWELWNEPDGGYWMPNTSSLTAKTNAYDTLFDYTEAALHSVMPNAQLSGPEMASPYSIAPFLSHCATGKNAVTGATGTRLDQVSFHAKGGTAIVNGHVEMSLRNQLILHKTGFTSVDTVNGGEFKSKPIVVGEADPDGCAACPISTTPANAYRNVPAYGAYEAAMMKHTLTLADSLGVHLRALLAWAWEFNDSTQPFIDGYRDLADNGVQKPVANVFKMLGRLHGTRIPVVSSGALGLAYILNNPSALRGTQAPDIDGIAAKSDSSVQVLLWNYHDDIVPVPDAVINLTVTLPSTFPSQVYVTHWRMDTTHSNANTKWIAMGSPAHPTPSQLDTLHKYMQLELLNPQQQMTSANGQIALNFALPRFGVSLIEITPTSMVDIVPLPPSSRWIALRASTLDVDLNEDYVLRVVDMAGRQLFVANGRSPQQFSLPRTLRPGAYRVEVQSAHHLYSQLFTGI